VQRPFEEIVAEHGRTVLRVCRALLGPHDAEDAWSETFLAALRAYPELPASANVQAWLVTIAHHKAIDALRARRRRPIPAAEPLERATLTGVWQPRNDELWNALRALPTKQRQALAYHHLAGLSYAEIAGLLGGSTDAARRAASDGLKNLRRTYPGRGEKAGIG
jgi:RNA polymerase sigma factor (sigma-70 family)